MSKQAEDQAETAHYAKWIFWVVVIHLIFSTAGGILQGVSDRFCADHGYTSYIPGHCVRTVNGTDQVVPLEQLRENQDVQATD